MMAARVTILLVEDYADDVIGSALRRSSLRRSGIAAFQVVPDGLAAVRYLKGERPYQNRGQFPIPRLIFLDLDMPRMTGFRFLEWLRSEPRLTHLPVVVLSAFSPEVCQTCLWGANSFLSKPVAFAELESALQQVVDFWLGEYQRLPVAA